MSVVKMWVQVFATVLAAVIPAFAAGPLDVTGWINVIILTAGVLMVYNGANIPGWNFAKLIASAVSAVAVIAVSAITDGFQTAEYMQMGLALLGALGVGAIPNNEASARPPHVV